MANPYLSPQQFLDWLPRRFAGEQTDDIGGLVPSNPIIQDALDEAAEDLNSGLDVRDDIPVPVLNADGTVPTRVIKFMRRVGLYNLYDRRGYHTDTVLQMFEVEMTWLDQVVRRRKNIIIIDADGNQTSDTTEDPLVGWDNGFSSDRRHRHRFKRGLFDYWTF